MTIRSVTGVLLLLACAATAHASSPALPGFKSTTTSHPFTAAVAIPDSGTLTRTVTVSGINPYIWDVDISTFIQHPLSGGTLTIKLMSPQGTTVILSTHNSFPFLTYYILQWDDQGSAAATDINLLTNILPASVQPEGAMGAFIGENPNGVWTLTVTDDASDADSGNLDVADLILTTFPAAPPERSYSIAKTLAEPIPDNAPALNSTQVVSGLGTNILRTTLTTQIAHTACGELDIFLISPSGTVVTLSTDNGGSLDNCFNGTVWRDKLPAIPVTDAPLTNNVTAQFLIPEGAMSAFNGENPNGTWTLQIRDQAAGNTGTLNGWTLNITTLPLAPSVTSGLIATPSPATTGQTVTFNFGVSDDDALSFAWNFGDGATATTSTGSTTHTYTTAGDYSVAVTATDPSNLKSTGALTLSVAAPGSGGGGGGSGGSGSDTDGDGFSDAIEISAGTLPNDPNSFPQIGGGSGGGGGGTLLLPDAKLAIKLNFAKPASDSLSLSGTLIVPTGFAVAGAQVVVTVGGISNTFTLDAKGGSKSATGSLKIGVKGSGTTAKFSLKLSKGDFAAQLADEGLIGTADVKDKPVQIAAIVSFASATYQKVQSQLFSAKTGKSGASKDKK